MTVHTVRTLHQSLAVCAYTYIKPQTTVMQQKGLVLEALILVCQVET